MSKVKSDQSSWGSQKEHRAIEFFLIELYSRTSNAGDSLLLMGDSDLHLYLGVVRIK